MTRENDADIGAGREVVLGGRRCSEAAVSVSSAIMKEDAEVWGDTSRRQ
jgi:hypothetical protein